jgi:DNA adenine methylase
MTSRHDKANPPPRRPLIRYHGAKWLLAPWIIEHLPQHRVYVEPFGGSAAVLLRKPRVYAEIYNDLDAELVNLFRVARDHGTELKRRLILTPFAREEFVAAHEPSDDSIESARFTVIKAFMGHGSNSIAYKSGFRANSNRSGTTPARDWMNHPDALDGIIGRLRGVIIENRDALQVMEAHDSPQTLHYIDPPYVADTRSGCKGYRHEMDDEEHVRLASFLKRLTGKVVVSGYRCSLYDSLFGDWERVDRDALADGAAKRVESLWLSPGVSVTDLFRHSRESQTAQVSA